MVFEQCLTVLFKCLYQSSHHIIHVAIKCHDADCLVTLFVKVPGYSVRGLGSISG